MSDTYGYPDQNDTTGPFPLKYNNHRQHEDSSYELFLNLWHFSHEYDRCYIPAFPRSTASQELCNEHSSLSSQIQSTVRCMRSWLKKRQSLSSITHHMPCGYIASRPTCITPKFGLDNSPAVGFPARFINVQSSRRPAFITDSNCRCKIVFL